MSRTMIKRVAATALAAGALVAGTAAGTATAAPAAPTKASGEVVVCFYKVSASAANVRTGPSVNRTSLGYVFRGQSFTSRPSKSKNGWIHGYGNGHTGWVKGSLLALQNCHREFT